jgi:hypothetical protein
MFMEKARHSRTIIATVAVLFNLLCWHDVNSNYQIASAAPGTSQSRKAMGGEGWYKTIWGMTPEKVSAAIGIKITPASEQDMRNYKTEYQYIIPDFKIGNFAFSVYLAFKPGKGLNDVMVTKKGQDEHFACFLELEDSLKKKYGTPSAVEDDDNMRMNSQSHSREWLTQSSVIKLNHIVLWIQGKPHYTTNVLYSARSSVDDRL